MRNTLRKTTVQPETKGSTLEILLKILYRYIQIYIDLSFLSRLLDQWSFSGSRVKESEMLFILLRGPFLESPGNFSGP